ncbi:MAG: carboxylating nicotinate-nucleotide diphosphorylase [Verrucomicrobia bacterium]|nr:carboxylating nicotinate-nucleotide diphosphorylase [Verrucomicrobiota bacterium]MDA0723656.1 carboxylating nicotinate-nucleotide diphosphorylase [Verrucomicrobiota bacterium]MDA1047299.1 carboxylating nicotinate-nucleotide diphosphorylase [Verrucomicrobiota bacterium]
MKEPAALSHFRQRLSWDDLDKDAIRKLVRLAAEEDLHGKGLKKEAAQTGDQTTISMGVSGQGTAAIVAREPLVACGLQMIPLILEEFEVENAAVENSKSDGDEVETGETLAFISGAAVGLLATERTLLNFIQRLSGVATASKAFVKALSETNTGLLDTRKTTPGYRALEKYATATGGFFNHRYGLNDRILVKDNHLAANRATKGNKLAESVARLKATGSSLLIEVEVDCREQIAPVLSAGVDAILLDNFSVEEVAKAVEEIQGRAVVEASGGITLESARQYADASPHFLSTGAPVHHSSWMDLGLDWTNR